MTQPNLVSIIIPCYNNATCVVETLTSVLEQTYKAIEVILVDDGSRDNSVAVAENYLSQQKDLNYKIIQQENQGPSKARNHGVTQANGSYLFFIDADDRIHPDAIRQYEAVLESDATLNIVYSETEFFGAQEGIFVLNEFKLPQFLHNNCIPISAMVRKEIFNAVGGFDENLRYQEDWELWIKIVKNYGGVYKIPTTLFYYRKRFDKSSLTDTREDHSVEETSRLYIYTKHFDFYKQYQLDIPRVFQFVDESERLRKKYYGIWYKKLFYSLVKRKN